MEALNRMAKAAWNLATRGERVLWDKYDEIPTSVTTIKITKTTKKYTTIKTTTSTTTTTTTTRLHSDYLH